jgi:hypothetical protein
VKAQRARSTKPPSKRSARATKRRK